MKVCATVILAVGMSLVAPHRTYAVTTSATCASMPPVAADSASEKGEKLRKTILCNVLSLREKVATAREAAHSANGWNALISVLGGLATGIAVPGTAKW